MGLWTRLLLNWKCICNMQFFISFSMIGGSPPTAQPFTWSVLLVVLSIKKGMEVWKVKSIPIIVKS